VPALQNKTNVELFSAAALSKKKSTASASG
jgi:hypothetical protein